MPGHLTVYSPLRAQRLPPWACALTLMGRKSHRHQRPLNRTAGSGGYDRRVERNQRCGMDGDAAAF